MRFVILIISVFHKIVLSFLSLYPPRGKYSAYLSRKETEIISHGRPPIREFPSALDTSVCYHSTVAKAKSQTKSVVYPFLYEITNNV